MPKKPHHKPVVQALLDLDQVRSGLHTCAYLHPEVQITAEKLVEFAELIDSAAGILGGTIRQAQRVLENGPDHQ